MSGPASRYRDMPEGPLEPLTEQELRLVQRVFSDPLAIPAEWKAWLRADLERDPPVFGENAITRTVPKAGSVIDDSVAAGANIAVSKLLEGNAGDILRSGADPVWVKQSIGRVSGAGAVVSGTGFTAVRNALGSYTVTFTAAFPAVPVVIVTPFGATAVIVTISAIAAGSFTVKTYDAAGAAVDAEFLFWAETP